MCLKKLLFRLVTIKQMFCVKIIFVFIILCYYFKVLSKVAYTTNKYGKSLRHHNLYFIHFFKITQNGINCITNLCYLMSSSCLKYNIDLVKLIETKDHQ